MEKPGDRATGEAIEAGERPPTLAGALATLRHGVEQLGQVDLGDATARELLDGVETLEGIRRPLDRETDRLSARVDASGAYGLDGHRTAKAALKAQGRVSGPEAHTRLRCGRMLRTMPAVDAGYAAGRRRRLFSGCSRDAVLLQAALRTRDRLRCAMDGCDVPSHRIQADHDEEWNEGGTTDVANGNALCGPHNVLKHHLRRASDDALDLWQVRRPE